MAKYGMSMCVLGMAEELKKDGIAVNALWPRTGIHTDMYWTLVLCAMFSDKFCPDGKVSAL